mmetsp:Transcript_173130/g.555146  ORF Transcript_173130/g.555146 Transcript_173130/m.555146 type:complete len:206 (+) Transcript_173130:77-694(+)
MELQQCGARCTSGFAIESTEAGVSALGVQNARVEIADGPRADRSSTQFEQPIGDVVVAVADADVAEVPPGGAEKGGEGKGGAPHQVDQKQPQPAPRRSRRWLRCCCSSKKPQRAIASFSLRSWQAIWGNASASRGPRPPPPTSAPVRRRGRSLLVRRSSCSSRSSSLLRRVSCSRGSARTWRSMSKALTTWTSCCASASWAPSAK